MDVETKRDIIRTLLTVGRVDLANVVRGAPRTALALLSLPYVKQATEYTCGAAALQAVLLYYGELATELELQKELHTTKEEGTSPDAIVKAARSRGLLATAIPEMGLDRLRDLILGEIPVIIAYQAWQEGPPEERIPARHDWEDGHYSVVIGMDADTIYLEDPSATERVTIPIEQFLERWHDRDGDGFRRYHQLGIVITRP